MKPLITSLLLATSPVIAQECFPTERAEQVLREANHNLLASGFVANGSQFQLWVDLSEGGWALVAVGQGATCLLASGSDFTAYPLNIGERG